MSIVSEIESRKGSNLWAQKSVGIVWMFKKRFVPLTAGHVPMQGKKLLFHDVPLKLWKRKTVFIFVIIIILLVMAA